jgi:hypothetical protein
MHRTLAFALSLCFLPLILGCQKAVEEEEGPATGAPYVFAGTVLKPQSSTVGTQPPNEKTYAVRVDEVLFQKGIFVDLTDNEITVFADDQNLESGGTYFFYTDPMVFGRSVAVKLIEAKTGERPDPTEVRMAHEKQELRRELQRADLVVVGRIEGVEPFKQEPVVDTEHWPNLQVAYLGVERVLKGDVGDSKRIDFLFAFSRDVLWYRSPKVEVGDNAVFLLEIGGSKALSMKIKGEKYTLFEPMDVQPLDRLGIIEEILR